MGNSFNSREWDSILSQYKELLQTTEWEYLKLVTIINNKLATLPKWSKLGEDLRKWISRDWTKIQYWDRPGAATWGNMEWSLYIEFNGNTLRFRRAGDNALYLDNMGNYFKTSWGFWEKHIIPGRIEWETITDISEKWVTVIDNTLVQENNDMLNNRHKTVGKDIEEQRKKVWYKIKKLFSRDKEKSIFELEPEGMTKDEMKKTIDIDILNQKLALVTKWLQKAARILEEGLKTTNNN